MNGAVLGLLLIGLAQGIASVACWQLLTTRWRVMPALLTVAYYVAMYTWPHAAIVAARRGAAYPDGDQVRLLLLGLATICGVVLLVLGLTKERDRDQS